MAVMHDNREPLSDAALARWETDGYVIVRALWSAAEVAACRQRFDAMGDAGQAIEGHWHPGESSAEPLRRYPRVMMPHRFDDLTRAMLLDARVEAVLKALMDDEPIATQSMYYFKPPGGKGQALHQDNYYLRVKPHSCVAAWTAIDRSDPDNGGLWVCPGTHTYAVQCPELANPDESFTTDFVAPPNGSDPVPAVLDPGDVLFFNGSVVHGSRPNTTADRWRRSLICHYMPAAAKQIARDYQPCLRFDGSEYRVDFVDGGGPCGTEFAGGLAPMDWEDAAAAGRVPVKSGSIPA